MTDEFNASFEEGGVIHDGGTGYDGKSAYQLAVENGFNGSVSEWLESLKGDKGDRGEQGERGEKGDTGEKGADGVNGKDGKDGKDGLNGVDGKDGEDGKSAYELAVDNGFSGTLAEWLNSLKGAKGDKGDTGESGSGGESHNNLYGKKLLAIGDSFVYGHTLGHTSGKTWEEKIAARNDMQLYVYAQNGISLAGANSNTIAKGLSNAIKDIDGVDYIVVLGGHNDSYASQNNGVVVPIGSNNDSSSATFKGGLNYIISMLRSKYTSAQILFVTPFFREGSEKPYANAMKEVCAYRFIPCFDSASSGMDFVNTALRNMYELNGSKHFNEIGQERLSLVIETVLNNNSAINTPNTNQIEYVNGLTAYNSITKNANTFYGVKGVGLFHGLELVVPVKNASISEIDIALSEMDGTRKRVTTRFVEWVGVLTVGLTMQFLDDSLTSEFKFAIGEGDKGLSTPWIGGGWSDTPSITIDKTATYTVAFAHIDESIAVTDEEWNECISKFGYKTSVVNEDDNSGAEQQINIENEVTSYTIKPNILYCFNVAASSLDITFDTSNIDNSIVNDFHFMFVNGSTACELTLPNGVIVNGDFEIKANSICEISVVNNLLTFQNWSTE